MWLYAFPAFAYETDQLTKRTVPLADAEPYADAVVQDLIDQAITETNDQLGCSAPVDEARRTFVRAFAGLVSQPVRVPGRGFTRGFGYDRVGAALETGPEDKLTFDHHDDVYADVDFADSLIIRGAGISSTIQLSGVRLGTDKLDHFLVQGYEAWRRDQQGKDPVAYATDTERTFLGWWTSDTFSYADLAADYAGWQFYRTVAESDSLVALDGRGCVASARPFRWSDWVTRDWDEVENPSVYRPAVEARVQEWLDQHQDEVCAAFPEWADPGFAQRVAEHVEHPPVYAYEAPVPRTDPFELAKRCRS